MLKTQVDRDQNRWTGLVRAAVASQAITVIGLLTLMHSVVDWPDLSTPIALRQLLRDCHIGWRRWKKISAAASTDMSVNTLPGIISQIQLHPDTILHNRGATEPYVAVSSAVARSLIYEHHLSLWDVGWLIRALALDVHEASSMRELSRQMPGDRSTITRLISKLVECGLVTVTQVGRCHAVRMDILDVMELPKTRTVARPVRRKALRQATSNRERMPEADSVAKRLCAHFGLPPSPIIRQVAASLLGAGMTADGIVTTITGMGGLNGALSGEAVIIGRMRSLLDEIATANTKRSNAYSKTYEMRSEDDKIQSDNVQMEAWNLWLGSTISEPELEELRQSRYPYAAAMKFIAETSGGIPPPGVGSVKLTDRLKR